MEQEQTPKIPTPPAESSNIVGEEAVRYSDSLARLQIIESGYEFRFNEAVELGIKKGFLQGFIQGFIQGFEQGIEQEKRNTARKLKLAGTDIDFISQITGLSKEVISML